MVSTKSRLCLDIHKIVSYSVHLSIIDSHVLGSTQRNTMLLAVLATSLMVVTANRGARQYSTSDEITLRAEIATHRLRRSARTRRENNSRNKEVRRER